MIKIMILKNPKRRKRRIKRRRKKIKKMERKKKLRKIKADLDQDQRVQIRGNLNLLNRMIHYKQNKLRK